MSQYPEEYSDDPALEAESSDALQPDPEPLDSGSESATGESVQQESSSVDYAPQIRDMYGRYGETNKRMDEINYKLDELNSTLKNNSSSESGDESIYDSMDANQRLAANQLVEQHPLVKELREFKDNVEGSRANSIKQQVIQNQETLSQAVEGIKENHGAEEAETVGRDLYQIAELAQWNLDHPYFKSKVQEHIDRLGGEDKEKQQGRRRAASERGSARASGGRLPTAKRKSPDGKEYYSFQAAAEIAEELASRNRKRD
tara:strand:+ start:152 stop:928 length:777 start_codon:yes stop_codon:yes gene_type:complete